jgi:hypothetical protein
MPRRLWGCYSVADHTEPRAFVADLLLYDRLVIPVPTDDDRGRWEHMGWNPDRLDRLLEVLGPLAERIVWSEELRNRFEGRSLQVSEASELSLDIEAGRPPRPDAYGISRGIVSEELRARAQATEGDVRGVVVYAKPDRFDSEWRFSWSLPFVKKGMRTQPGVLRQATASMPLQTENLAKLVVTRLAVPDDDSHVSDDEILKRTVGLVERPDVWRIRTAFHDLVASLDEAGLDTDIVVEEISDLVKELNAVVRNKSKAARARLAVQFIAAAEGAGAIALAPIGLAQGPTVALGEAAIERRWSSQGDPGLGAVVLLAEAQRALA